jgi:hypothetical protein
MRTGTQAIHEELLRVARSQQVVNYSDVGSLAGLNMDSPEDTNRIADILDGIGRAEHRAGKPLLSAVVIRRDRNMPGAGFFNLAKGLGLTTVGSLVYIFIYRCC